MTGSAVIFDLDGVLVDSEPYWREGFRTAVGVIAEQLGTAPPDLSDDDLRSYEGGRVPDTVRTLAEALFAEVPDELISEAVDQAVHRASALFAEDPRPIEASVRTAAELHERGARLAVASSSAPEFIVTVLERLDLARRVEVVESAFLLEHAKPHPEVYLNAIHGLDVPVERCTAIEDSWTGVQAALRAGLRTVWVTSEPLDSLNSQVKDIYPRDPDGGGDHPPLIFVRELGADAVQEFSEARP